MVDITSYTELLMEFQNYKDDEGNSLPKTTQLLPSDDEVYNVNLNSRTVDVPQFLSVKTEHLAEVIYFKCPRFFGNMDLARTTCVIEYINADGEAGIFWVPYYDVSHFETDGDDPETKTPMLYFPWGIGGRATKKAGKVTFAIKFYLLCDPERDMSGTPIDTQFRYLFNLTTRPATGEILYGMDLTGTELENYTIDTDILHRIYADISDASANLQQEI